MQTANLVAFILMGLVLLTAAAIDWKTHKVPNWLTYPAILAGLLLWTVAGAVLGGVDGAWEGVKASLVGFAAGFVPFFIIFTMSGIGGADVKLIGAVGAISAQWQVVLGTVVYMFLIGLVMAVVIMIHRRLVARTLLNILGAVVAVASKVKPTLPSDSPRVPYAVAMGLGGLLAGGEHLLGIPMPWSPWFS